MPPFPGKISSRDFARLLDRYGDPRSIPDSALDRCINEQIRPAKPRAAVEARVGAIEAEKSILAPPDGVWLDPRLPMEVGVEVLTAIILGMPRPSEYRSDAEREFVRWYLAPRIESGELTSWAYEPARFRIGRTSYTPDFGAVGSDGRVTMIEVKGGYQWSQDRTRIKSMPAAWPQIPLEVWDRKKSGWTREVITR